MIFENYDRIVFAGDSVTDMGSMNPVGEGPSLVTLAPSGNSRAGYMASISAGVFSMFGNSSSANFA